MIFNEGYEHNITLKKSRIISSIGQDNCYAASQTKWKLPKHVGLGMTAKHLFRREELMIIVGLKTTVANQLEKRSSLITNEIVTNPTIPALFHSGFNNFDQYINDVKGVGPIHTTHGIML